MANEANTTNSFTSPESLQNDLREGYSRGITETESTELLERQSLIEQYEKLIDQARKLDNSANQARIEAQQIRKEAELILSQLPDDSTLHNRSGWSA